MAQRKDNNNSKPSPYLRSNKNKFPRLTELLLRFNPFQNCIRDTKAVSSCSAEMPPLSYTHYLASKKNQTPLLADSGNTLLTSNDNLVVKLTSDSKAMAV